MSVPFEFRSSFWHITNPCLTVPVLTAGLLFVSGKWALPLGIALFVATSVVLIPGVWLLMRGKDELNRLCSRIEDDCARLKTVSTATWLLSHPCAWAIGLIFAVDMSLCRVPHLLPLVGANALILMAGGFFYGFVVNRSDEDKDPS